MWQVAGSCVQNEWASQCAHFYTAIKVHCYIILLSTDIYCKENCFFIDRPTVCSARREDCVVVGSEKIQAGVAGQKREYPFDV
jgi:hypothetical protein